MKRLVLASGPIVFLVILGVALGGCSAAVGSTQQIAGSGKLVTNDYDLSGFDSINAGSNFRLNVHPGDKFAVSVTADDNVMPILSVGRSGSELRLSVKPGSYGFDKVTMKADVILPALKAIILDGNATAHVDAFTSANLTFQLKSNSIVDGSVAAGELLLDAGGNAQARLTGAADTMVIKGAGNAILNLGGLTAHNAVVNINSNALATVDVVGKLDYSASGNAGLTYSGGATLGEQKTGGNGWARQR